MSKEKIPTTPAVRFLQQEGIAFAPHLYTYVEKGGTANAARQLEVDEHAVVKTLIMEDDAKNPLVILMHGDRQVSTREMARTLGVKTVSPSSPEAATKHTGYTFGGTSPFGTRKPLPVYIEETILELPRVYINGGKRGFLVQMSPADLTRCLSPTPVQASQ